MEQKDLLIALLADVLALERSLVPALRERAEDPRRHPEISNKLRAHLHDTERHIALLEGCLTGLGAGQSSLRGAELPRLRSSSVEACGGEGSKLVACTLDGYGAVCFKVAYCRAAVEAARNLGETAVAGVCEEVLRDNEKLATWLEKQIPRAVDFYLAQPVA
jgi:ferritin-like metal-binding protein YciE